MHTNYAIFYAPSAYSLSGKVMGRQSAGAAFLKAIANTQPDKLWCYAKSKALAQNCAQSIASLGSPRTGIAWIPMDQPSQLKNPGVLFRPDPGISAHAWHRLNHADPRAYSICGITHTISSHGPMTAFTEYLTGPVEPWDAVICTSRAARDAVKAVVEQQAAYLSERLGASRFSLPQFPIIPLGVHTENFVSKDGVRAAARARLEIAADEVVILFAGRLIVHSKAHPLPMYIALEKASKNRKVVLIQAGQAPSNDIRKIFVEEAAQFCPSVRNIMVDGSDFDLYNSAWAAADIFTSLSDNIQETFGLTPVEAMAAGLPCVVSDWDGYRDTVRDNIDGFRIPTLSLPPGQGGTLADQFEMEIINFDYYSAYASQLVAVNIDAAAEAYRRLIDDADLRKRMGTSGAERARRHFDWSVVFSRYLSLWEELAERRRADPQLAVPLSRRRRPDRADPFSMFSTYPTHHTNTEIQFKVRKGITTPEAISRRELSSTNFAKAVTPSADFVNDILSSFGDEWIDFNTVISMNHKSSQDDVQSALVWLSKVGVLDFRKE